MATWAEVQERVRSQFQLDRDDAEEFSLTVPRQAEGSRAQRVMVHHYRAWDKDMIEFRSAFGESEAAAAPELLAEGLKLPLGAIARHGAYLVVVHKACLEYLSLDGVVFLLTRVSLLADILEERRGGDRF